MTSGLSGAGKSSLCGTLRGNLLTSDVPDDTSEVFEARIGSLVFHLGGEDSTIVHGSAVDPDGVVEMATNVDQVRAVIGGTGTYFGARGQVTTTRNDDGTDAHHFELLD
jgi:GTPase SAR1 family protein